jgi:hypothetical protein
VQKDDSTRLKLARVSVPQAKPQKPPVVANDPNAVRCEGTDCGILKVVRDEVRGGYLIVNTSKERIAKVIVNHEVETKTRREPNPETGERPCGTVKEAYVLVQKDSSEFFDSRIAEEGNVVGKVCWVVINRDLPQEVASFNEEPGWEKPRNCYNYADQWQFELDMCQFLRVRRDEKRGGWYMKNHSKVFRAQVKAVINEGSQERCGATMSLAGPDYMNHYVVLLVEREGTIFIKAPSLCAMRPQRETYPAGYQYEGMIVKEGPFRCRTEDCKQIWGQEAP